MPSALGSTAAASSVVADLDQAQIGPEGVLAHELGIDRDEIGAGKPVAERLERFGVGDQGVNLHRAPLIAGACMA